MIVDGTDNFPTRYLVNDASLLKRIPVVHGSIFRFEGQATVFDPYVGPCYRCMIPEPPPAELAPSCSEAGVLGVLPGIIGSIQAVEAIKMLLGIGDPLVGPAAGLRRPGGVASGPSRSAATRSARPAGPTPARSSSPSTTTCACPTREAPPQAEPSTGRLSRPGAGHRNLCAMAPDGASNDARATSGSPTRASRSARSTGRPTSRAGTPTTSWASPGSYPYTRGIQRRHVPGPAVDHAPVRRVRDGRVDQRAVQVPARAPARPGCRAPSTCPPRWATTPTIPGPRARWARSGWPSTRWPTCACCWPACRSTRSPPR